MYSLDSYLSHKNRDSLALLCQQHPKVRQICKEEVKDTALSENLRLMLHALLETIERIDKSEEEKMAQRQKVNLEGGQ